MRQARGEGGFASYLQQKGTKMGCPLLRTCAIPGPAFELDIEETPAVAQVRRLATPREEPCRASLFGPRPGLRRPCTLACAAAHIGGRVLQKAEWDSRHRARVALTAGTLAARWMARHRLAQGTLRVRRSHVGKGMEWVALGAAKEERDVASKRIARLNLDQRIERARYHFALDGRCSLHAERDGRE